MESGQIAIEGEAPSAGMYELIAELGQVGFGDLESLFAEDVAAEDWMEPGAVIRGREELRGRFFDPIRVAFPDVVFKVRRALNAAGNLIIVGFFEATFESEYFGFSPHGRPCRWEARDIYRFQDGKIDFIWFANDTLTVARELGARIEDDRLW